ncbi:CPBP family glutamic-type intramembrane protease [Ideonella sp. YS5]|uniref:CPBP family glutamic-type intramembrane protease n=1 Tax=Ideonella sp. YS5 TaxID=3453714 RepID=UPI003F7182F9
MAAAFAAAIGPALCAVLYAAGACRGPLPMAAAVALAVALYGSVQFPGRSSKACFALAGVLILLMAAGVVPGFARLPVGHLSINSAKALAGLAALAMFPSFWAWNRSCSAMAVACLSGVPLLAWSVGFVHWAPASPGALVAFAASNVFTVIAEEWFFRHWVQRPLARWSMLAGVVASALLFGLVHLGGGLVFAGLATVAGLAYAGVFAASRGSIWAAVALHGALNLLRVALFGL